MYLESLVQHIIHGLWNSTKINFASPVEHLVLPACIARCPTKSQAEEKQTKFRLLYLHNN